LLVFARSFCSTAESTAPLRESRNFKYPLTRLMMGCLTLELPAEFAASLSEDDQVDPGLVQALLAWTASRTTAGRMS
jgi:hypothetical protein